MWACTVRSTLHADRIALCLTVVRHTRLVTGVGVAPAFSHWRKSVHDCNYATFLMRRQRQMEYASRFGAPTPCPEGDGKG